MNFQKTNPESHYVCEDGGAILLPGHGVRLRLRLRLSSVKARGHCLSVCFLNVAYPSASVSSEMEIGLFS